MTTTIIEERLKALDSIPLLRGSHDPPNGDKQFSAMEAAAWIAGEEHSDRPKCVSPVLGAYVRPLNDALDDEQRQALKPAIPRMIGTAGDGHDVERTWMAADWLVRVCIPAWLDLAGIKDSAKALRSLPPVTEATFNEWQPAVKEAREKAAAAEAAAWAAAAAEDAARDAGGAGDAAWAAAAWTAARDAAGVAAARAATRAAALAAVWAAAARTAARAAAEAAVWAAAWATVWDAARDAAVEAKEQGGNHSAQYNAAYRAAKAKLDSEPIKQRFESVKVELQRSAHELLDRMIDGPFGEENTE